VKIDQVAPISPQSYDSRGILANRSKLRDPLQTDNLQPTFAEHSVSRGSGVADADDNHIGASALRPFAVGRAHACLKRRQCPLEDFDVLLGGAAAHANTR
jgi:hypothetical protein